MQRSGTYAISTQIQPSKPKREKNHITNSQNTKRTYGQPSVQLFPKRRHTLLLLSPSFFFVILFLYVFCSADYILNELEDHQTGANNLV